MKIERALQEKDARQHVCWRTIAPKGERTNCLASQCMAWVMVDQIGIGPNGEIRSRDMDGRTTWVSRGRCGLVEPFAPVASVDVGTCKPSCDPVVSQFEI